MSLPGNAKHLFNRLARPFNVKLESLTAEKAESTRLAGLESEGHFSKAVFPLLPQFERCDPVAIFKAVASSADKLARFAPAAAEDGGFSLDNHYYTTPDAEVLYAMVQIHRPRLVVEIGSGNSTLLFRQAITDAGIATQVVSIDPEPRRNVAQHADLSVRERVEGAGALSWFAQLRANDILFIDSSHEIKTGNDVLFLLLKVIPTLAPGVIVHIHDIFLPYEYPRDWVIKQRWNWTEQYLVQALLQDSDRFDVLWAGHYLQRSRPDFISHFKSWRSWDARSLWLQRLAGAKSS
ncbi:MAG TPA: class I SAM-dependent methyltransferase [Lacunisphaera sp.]|jgi:predicted O-methyltransferase YrrM